MVTHRIAGRLAGSVLACLSIATLVVFVPVAVQSAPVVEASDCWQAMPWAPLGNVVVGTGASGAFAVAPSLTAPVVLTGAATATAAAPGAAIAGTVGLSVAAFLAASAGTCKFLDWATTDGDAMTTNAPLVGVLDATSASAGAQLLGNEIPSIYYTLAPQGAVRSNFDPPTAPWNSSWRVQLNSSAFTINNNVFPKVASSPQYPAIWQPPSATLFDNDIVGLWKDTAPYGTVYGTSERSTATLTFFTKVGSAALTVDECAFAGVRPEQAVGVGIGGNCGLHPRTIVVLSSIWDGVRQVQALYYANSEAARRGWARQIVTDSLCKELDSSSEQWVRATSAVYYDREVSARIEVPSCPVGSVPRITRVQRVPVKPSACTLGTVCFGNENIIYQHTLPTSLTTAYTTPDWRFCLGAGADCGVPAVVDGVCMWNVYTMPSNDSCDAGQIAGTAANPATVAVATGTITPVSYVEGEPASTAVTVTVVDPETPTTTVVGTSTAPIDPGVGLGGGTVEDQAAVCWPDGWGWFNPGQWVLRPIKCAIEWSFVPSGPALDERLASFAALSDDPPLAWISEGTSYVGGSSLTFGEWSAVGPECTFVLDTQICPRDWDNPSAVPPFLLGIVLFGLWSSLVFAVWRWF
jgi:hypothetical protein